MSSPPTDSQKTVGEAPYRAARDVLHSFLSQLINGCDCIKCTNKYCKSCPDFIHKEESKESLAHIAVEWALNYSETAKEMVCHGLNPLTFNKQLLPLIKDFDDFAKHFASDNSHQYGEKEKRIVENVLTNPIVIPHLLKDANNTVFNNFYENSKRQDNAIFKDFFDGFQNALNEVMVTIEATPNVTFYGINFLFVSLYLYGFMPCNDVSETIVRIIAAINRLPEEGKNLLSSYYIKCPSVLPIVLEVCKDQITYAVICLEEKNRQYQGAISIISTFINILSNWNYNSTEPIQYTNFNHDLLTQFLKSRIEYANFLDQRTIKYHRFMDTPAVLTLPFKNNILIEYFETLQNREASRIINERHFMIQNRRDLQLTIEINRNSIVDDTIKIISRTQNENFFKKLLVIFKGEQGVDAGGVSREFFYLLCNELFDEKFGMFRKIKGKEWFLPSTFESPIYFQVLGTVVALAIYNSVILPIRFPYILYKKLKNLKLHIHDLIELDPELVQSFTNLRKMKDEGGNIADLDLYFSTTIDIFGTKKEREICEGGIDKQVTNENLEEYIETYLDWWFNKSIESQFMAFQRGFNKICKEKVFMIFAPEEFDILVSGEPVLDWANLKQNAKYSDGYNENSQAIKWFWEIFNDMTNEQKEQFLRFSTGSDRAPVGGLKDFVITIQKINDPGKLPVSHTCFNIFSLPNYRSKEEMKKMILIAIQYNEGFGLI